MPFARKYAITQRYLPMPSNRRRGRLISPGVKFLVAHDTGNPGSTARQNVDYFYRTPDVSASAHLFVDDVEIIECVPALTGPPEKAWHVLYNARVDQSLYGYSANDAAIGVEYCYGDHIDADAAYQRYVWLLACLCDRFGLDPARAIVGHFILDPHRKTDPQTGLAHSRRSYEQLLRDVVVEYAACGGARLAPPPLPPVVVTTTALNIRHGAPRRSAPVIRVAAPGTRLPVAGLTREGEPINGNASWYYDPDGNYFWSGACEAAPPS